MSLAFRNIAASPDDPVESWPAEGVVTALERGDIRILRRLAAAVDAEPWGRTARQIEEAFGHTRPYGVTELMAEVIRRARNRAETAERAEVVADLSELILRSGLSREGFARRMGTSRTRLSTYVNGSVVPSAALLVRARRIADAESTVRSGG